MGHESSCSRAKTHLVNGVLGYEAQLVNAVIASSSAINGRFHYRYGGDWERCTRTQEITRKNTVKMGNTALQNGCAAGLMKTKSGYSSRSARFCAVNQKSPGGSHFISLESSHVILLCGFLTRNSRSLIWASNTGRGCIAEVILVFTARMKLNKDRARNKPGAGAKNVCG